MKPKKTSKASPTGKGKAAANPKATKIRKETVESLSDDELGDVAGGMQLGHSALCATRKCFTPQTYGCPVAPVKKS